VINKKTLLSTVLIGAALTPALTMASGYKINEQSAAGMGTAHAGRAAMAEDASVVFYNPAAMTELDRAQFTGGFTYINADGAFEGSSTNVVGVPSTLEGYDNGGDFLGEAFIPFMYYVRPINEKMSFGLAVFTPFGTNTDYNDTFVGGGFADETSLKSLEIQPSFAYKINDELSVGGGIDIVYMEGLLSKQSDLIPYVPGNPLLGSAQGAESHFEVEGDDWGYGWNIGAYYKFGDDTTLGFSYRSEIEITLEGDAELANDGTLTFFNKDTSSLVTLGARTQASEVPLTTPQSATFAVTHQLTDAVLLQAGTTWTGWSSFESFDVIATENASGGFGDGFADVSDLAGLGNGYEGHIEENWKDVWAASVGVTYQLNDKVALRSGYAFDQSPVTDEYRTARVPSSDRQWLTVGAQYVLNADVSFDVAAGYLFMDTMSLNEVNKDLNNNQKEGDLSNVTGEYEIDVFSMAFQVNYKL